jgi:hypothetical protein
LHVGIRKQRTYIPTSVKVTAFVIHESPSAESVTSIFWIRIQANIDQFILSGVLQSATKSDLPSVAQYWLAIYPVSNFFKTSAARYPENAF